jgi:hypothetical protein
MSLAMGAGSRFVVGGSSGLGLSAISGGDINGQGTSFPLLVRGEDGPTTCSDLHGRDSIKA